MFKEKIKNDKKFRAQFISGITVGVVVLACAITIPVCVHNSNVKKALATTEVETTTEQPSATEEVSTTEEETTTAVETTVTAETETTEKITEKTTKKPSSGNKPGNGGSNGGGSGSGPNSGSNSSGGSGNQNNNQEQTAVNPDRNWTQADVDRAVADAKAYARSKGLSIDSSLTEQGTSWGNPVETWLDSKSKATEILRGQIDTAYNIDIQSFGYIPEGASVNIFSKRCEGTKYSSGQPYWEIYVVW